MARETRRRNQVTPSHLGTLPEPHPEWVKLWSCGGQLILIKRGTVTRGDFPGLRMPRPDRRITYSKTKLIIP